MSTAQPHKPSTLLSRKTIRSVLLAAAASLPLWHLPAGAAPSNVGDSPGVASNPADISAKPAIGNINGIKLSIPHYYLLSGVQYAGEEPLSVFRSFTPTYDSKIEDFGILLRLSTLQPRKTEQDREDYIKSMNTVKPFLYETWTTIDFSPTGYWPGSVKTTVQRWETNAYRGPFVKQNDRIAGLVQEDTTQTNLSDSAHPNYDFYYDDKTFDTFISCQNNKQRVSPYAIFTICQHWFIIPELKLKAEAFYTKKDLPRWREIEAESRKIIHSFIVH